MRWSGQAGPSSPQPRPATGARMPDPLFQQAPGQGQGANPATAKPSPKTPPTAGGRFDYSSNIDSDVFGANLFTGAFAASTAAIFNPDHVIGIGDQLQVRLWGGFQFEALLTVADSRCRR